MFQKIGLCHFRATIHNIWKNQRVDSKKKALRKDERTDRPEFRGSCREPVIQKTNSNVYPIKNLAVRNRNTGTIKTDQGVK